MTLLTMLWQWSFPLVFLLLLECQQQTADAFALLHRSNGNSKYKNSEVPVSGGSIRAHHHDDHRGKKVMVVCRNQLQNVEYEVVEFDEVQDSSEDYIYKHPPYSPFGFIEIVEARYKLQYHKLLQESAKEVGPIFQLDVGKGKMLVIVGDTTVAKHILNDPTNDKPQSYVQKIRLLHGQENDVLTSPTNANDMYWKHSRKGMSPAFASKHIQRMIMVTQEYADDYIHNKLNGMADKEQSFEVSNEMLRLLAKISCEAAFEYRITEEETDELLSDIEAVFKEASRSSIPWRWQFGFLFPKYRRASRGTKRLNALAFKILDSCRRRQKYPDEDCYSQGTVIDQIIKNKSYKNDLERAADIIIVMAASFDTTSNSASWILIELAKNPEIQNKLREELKSTPVKDRVDLDSLQHIIKEGLRLHPVQSTGSTRQLSKDVRIAPRTVDSDNSDANMMVIPKGALVSMASIVRQLSPNYYENPESFQPSRWKDPTDEAVGAYLPFSAGIRNCIGRNLAYAELSCIISSLCSHFHFSLEEEGTEEFYTTLKPAGTRLIASRV